jgi:hypothetical protein
MYKNKTILFLLLGYCIFNSSICQLKKIQLNNFNLFIIVWYNLVKLLKINNLHCNFYMDKPAMWKNLGNF